MPPAALRCLCLVCVEISLWWNEIDDRLENFRTRVEESLGRAAAGGGGVGDGVPRRAQQGRWRPGGGATG